MEEVIKWLKEAENTHEPDKRLIYIQKVKQKLKKYCEWKKLEHKGDFYWETQCEQIHEFVINYRTRNPFKFCPYCGKKIKEVIDG